MVLVPQRYMMALLNLLGDRVQVDAPLLQHATLFTVDLAQATAHIEGIIDSTTYHARYKQVKEQVQAALPNDTAVKVMAEVPDHNRLCEAFRVAGIVSPENLGELERALEQARASNPARGGDIYYFAFDNNALRNRLYSLYLKPAQRGRPEPNMLLSRAVYDELDLCKGKILSKFLEAFNSAFPSLGVRQLFGNQNRLEDRLRLLARREWDKILQSSAYDVVKAGRKSDPDGPIIRSYAQFAATAGRKVVVLSSDNEFILRCGGRPNLIPQLVRYRLEIDEAYKADWEAVSWLLYHLAVVYGRLDLRRVDGVIVRVYGVWQGKGASDWDDERLKITVEPSNAPLEQALQRTMRILQAVGNP
ncbi:MAG: hypothetical protein K6U77_05845 [Armatimonadetes bacterium]|nr:hypothetical protein [Armatimonadota bacterium]